MSEHDARSIWLYKPFDIENPSFEADPPDTCGPPTGWHKVDGEDDSFCTRDTEYHSAGPGIPSSQSLEISPQNDNDYPEIHQRFSVGFIPQHMRGENGVRIGFYAMQKANNQESFGGGEAWIFFYKGGSSTPGTGTWINSPRWASMGMIAGTPGEWRLIGMYGPVPEDAQWVDFGLDFDPDEGWAGPDSICWFDRCFGGLVIEFKDKGFAKARIKRDLGFVNSATSEAVDITRVRPPSAQVEFELRNVVRGSQIDRELTFAQEILETDDYRTPGVLWLSARRWTNAEAHYQRCMVDPKLRIDYPPGPWRRNFRVRLIVPSEA